MGHARLILTLGSQELNASVILPDNSFVRHMRSTTRESTAHLASISMMAATIVDVVKMEKSLFAQGWSVSQNQSIASEEIPTKLEPKLASAITKESFTVHKFQKNSRILHGSFETKF